MLGNIRKIFSFSMVMLFVPMAVFAAQAPNLRGGNTSGRAQSGVVAGDSSGKTSGRSASNVVSRSATNARNRNSTVNSSRSATVRNVKTQQQTRSATPTVRKVARTATNSTAKAPTIARSAARQRATAVFNDVTKIGSGYTSCHDAYATCMDQFCANANDTYRRCFCSDKFTTFRDTTDALDKALTMLAEFQDNNLNAVDKTAAEVNAMYTAAEGEAAVKRDTSASQKLLDKISNLLSGKKDYSRKKDNSLGVLDFSSLSSAVSFDSGDIFSGDGFSLFGDTSGNISELEGKELYTNANKQCMEVIRDSCPNDAIFKLARSAYSILITQDCNVFEKNVNAKKESVKETIRTAERYLRDARLDEYRAHNSADVNACLAKVESALKESTACGPEYERCLDYTGRYINSVTGEPIYSPALLKLNELIDLNGSMDVLAANKQFNKFLDEKRIYAKTALDNCRDIADTVWYEFKRAALIQIAQAQDSKIQAVKDSCVATIRECYDRQSGELSELDTTDFAATGAISAVAARGMCYDRVMACAALYGDADGCAYDDKSKKLTAVSGKTCGLQSLLAFVDAVDAVKVAEGCEVSLKKYAHELCDPKTTLDEEETTEVYPAGCMDTPRSELRAAMEERARLFCAQDLVMADKSNTISSDPTKYFNLDVVNSVIKDLFDELDLAFSAGCEYTGGRWLSGNATIKPDISDLNQKFYQKYYGVVVKSASDALKFNTDDKGWCIVDSVVKEQCLAQNQTYDEYLNDCILSESWYSQKCQALGGTYANSQCEIPNITSVDDILNNLR